MADEAVAVSSTATVPQPVEVENLTGEQRTNWLKTGELPAKAKPEAPPASKPVEATDDKGADEKKAESGTAKPKPRTDERFQELLRERKEAREEADKLKKELAEIKAKGTTAPSEEKKAASLPPSDEPKAPERPKRPKLNEFSKMEDYDKAMDTYDEEMLKFPAKQTAFESAKSQFEKQKADITERQSKVQNAWKSIAEKGRELYGEEAWNKNAFNPQLPIFQNDPVERYLRESEPEVAANMLQHLALKPEELTRINGLSSREQFKALEKLEESLSVSEKDDEIEPPAEPPKKQVTAAKKPPSEVGGKSSAIEDEAEAAIKRNDTDAYIRIVNAREIAARKKGR